MAIPSGRSSKAYPVWLVKLIHPAHSIPSDPSPVADHCPYPVTSFGVNPWAVSAGMRPCWHTRLSSNAQAGVKKTLHSKQSALNILTKKLID